MNHHDVITDETLARARKLVREMEAGNVKGVNRLLDELGRMRESRLFQELGGLTRKLHEALNAFQLDARMTTLVEEEIPDARDCLNHVITMTDQAAHRTLSAAEETFPLSDELRRRGSELGGAWQRFLKREMTAEEFRKLSREVGEFLVLVANSASTIQSRLKDVMMAQEFQDLTGQIIRRVVTLVQEVEDNLVDLVKIAGHQLTNIETDDKTGNRKLEGPPIPGKAAANAVEGQDEVDTLLSSLGF